MHLVGFTIEIYYDAWPYEHQISQCMSLPLNFHSSTAQYYISSKCIPPIPQLQHPKIPFMQKVAVNCAGRIAFFKKAVGYIGGRVTTSSVSHIYSK